MRWRSSLEHGPNIKNIHLNHLHSMLSCEPKANSTIAFTVDFLIREMCYYQAQMFLRQLFQSGKRFITSSFSSLHPLASISPSTAFYLLFLRYPDVSSLFSQQALRSWPMESSCFLSYYVGKLFLHHCDRDCFSFFVHLVTLSNLLSLSVQGNSDAQEHARCPGSSVRSTKSE